MTSRIFILSLALVAGACWADKDKHEPGGGHGRGGGDKHHVAGGHEPGGKGGQGRGADKGHVRHAEHGKGPEKGHGKKQGHGHGGGSRGATYFQDHGYTRLKIPPGHYPGPGQCRVWFPGRPPGHQPAPVDCRRASVPPGAWLIRHPVDLRDHVHVVVYEPDRPDVMVVGEFDIGSGSFVRVVLTAD